MQGSAAALVLWLFVIFLGIAFGAGVFEHRIVVPRWITASAGTGRRWNADAAHQDDTGRRFWVFVTTVPLTLLTLVNLWVALRAPEPLRGWWLTAAVAAMVDRLFTFGYFIPTMVRLMHLPDTPQSVAAATRWSRLNYLRHAIVLIAWLAALQTFALFYQLRG